MSLKVNSRSDWLSKRGCLALVADASRNQKLCKGKEAFLSYLSHKAWAEENLMKLNLSKTKELVIRGRTTLPPPESIVTNELVIFEASRSDFSG